MAKIQNLFFDLDGTVADPLSAFESSLNHAFATLGKPVIDTAMVRKCIGPPLHKSLVEILGYKNEDVPEIMAAYRKHHEAHFLTGYSLYKGIKECLLQLYSHYQIFLATSKPHPFAKPLIQNFKLQPYFTGVYGAELDGTRSDKAELIAHILKSESLDPSATLMIGDRKFDIIGAKKNGMQSLGVLWGFGDRAELEEAGADSIVEKVNDLFVRLG